MNIYPDPHPELFYRIEQDLGLKEVDGVASNPIILERIQQFAPTVTDDSQYPNCAVQLVAICVDIGLNPEAATPAARSFLEVGTPIPPDLVERGDIVVFERKSKTNPNAGHVGVFGTWNYVGEWLVASYNDRNQCTYRPYPVGRLLGVVRLKCM